jgi:uncharacterized protein (DUF3084 family)
MAHMLAENLAKTKTVSDTRELLLGDQNTKVGFLRMAHLFIQLRADEATNVEVRALEIVARGVKWGDQFRLVPTQLFDHHAELSNSKTSQDANADQLDQRLSDFEARELCIALKESRIQQQLVELAVQRNDIDEVEAELVDRECQLEESGHMLHGMPKELGSMTRTSRFVDGEREHTVKWRD